MKQETEVIEFKESLANKDDAGKDICAFANAKGGTVYFGIKNNGDVVGLQEISEKTLRDLSQLYVDNTEPRLYPSITSEVREGKQVIKVTISKSTTPHHTYKKIPYIRSGTSSKVMSQAEYRDRLIKYSAINQDYSARIVEEATIGDLSPQALRNFRKLLNKSARFKQNIDSLNDTRLLKKFQLIQEDKMTIAAMVLLGSKEGLKRFLPFSEIRFAYKVSKGEARNQDMEIYEGGYFIYFNDIWKKIDARNITLTIPHGTLVVERKAFDEESLREAINNAIVHRDYQQPESTFVIQYHDSIEIKSPGGFVEGITISNILDESKPRNKLIADILFKCDIVEQFGTGVNLMFKNQLSVGKAIPNYSGSSKRKVVLALDGNIQDVEFAKYVLNVADAKDEDLNDTELLVLHKIKNGEKIKANNITANLLELGLIEKVTKGGWMLSKKYYLDTDQKGKYTRKKGMGKPYQKQSILEHLEQFPQGSKKQDLLDLFNNEIPWHTLYRVLSELRDENKIYFDGKQRSSAGVWRLK